MNNNIINLTDSYKFSHYNQYPKGTEIIHSYMSSRGGEYDELVFFGLKYYVERYLAKPITLEDIEETEELAKAQRIPFNKEGWLRLLQNQEGKILNVIRIKALEEGSIFKPHEPVLVIENKYTEYFWLVGWLETLLMKIWYPTTIATKSYHVKRMLLKHWEMTSENLEGVDFAYHNFGDRGSSSVESAAIGGVAHLTQFKGSDIINALTLSNKYYDGKYQGLPIQSLSIPGSEHATVTSWGKKNEFAMIEHYLETYKDSPIIACVLDSYDIYKAVEFVSKGKMKKKIESKDYPIFVIRPDSGNSKHIIPVIIGILLKNKVKYTRNSKGFILFDKYRIIWGDGVTPRMIDETLSSICYQFDINNPFVQQGISSENFAFGSGGDLMQNVNRDTCKFAIKCSAIRINGKWRDVYKEPITDPGKASLKGRQDNERLTAIYGG